MTIETLAETIEDELCAACIGGEIFNSARKGDRISLRFYSGEVFEIEVRKRIKKMPKIDPRTGKEI